MTSRTASTGASHSAIADVTSTLPNHFESSVEVNAPADEVFTHLDDHSRLSAHMTQPSWIMAGSRMTIELDAAEGRAVGAVIRLRGRVLGIPLSVEEIVTERGPPLRKVWNTTGRPRLLVIGPYRMGYEITPRARSAQLRVFIDYALPDGPIAQWLGRLFGSSYARWCTRRMANDAAVHFQERGQKSTDARGGTDEPHVARTQSQFPAIRPAPTMGNAAQPPRTETAPITFPVGYHRLHPDVSMNYQMNRWFGWVGEPGMLEEMRLAAPRITNYADWKREFVALAERACKEGNILRAAFYWRAAEFFMRADDPDRKVARTRFLESVRSVYGLELDERYSVPYIDGHTNGFLPAYRFIPAQSKGTIVFFGGFDSYIEELTSAFIYLRNAGYEVIAFEGPGQGGALDEAGVPMTAEWHKPVGAVLDYFEIEQAALIGLSLGGCLAVRAAALEPRVKLVVAYDVLTNFLDVNLRQTSTFPRICLKLLLKLRAASAVNWMVARVARTNPVVEWGIEQGKRVTGTGSAFDYVQAIKQFETADVSRAIRQDILVLAGHEDHYVPIGQWHDQIKLLTNARSVTARVFTRSESAENHCQAGNFGLALRTIVIWLDQMLLENADHYQSAVTSPAAAA